MHKRNDNVNGNPLVFTFLMCILVLSALAFIPYAHAISTQDIGGFTILWRSPAIMASQGVAFDGTYFYTTNSPINGSFNSWIYVYDTSFTLVTSENVSDHFPATTGQINSMTISGGKLYIGLSSFSSNEFMYPPDSYIISFGLPSFSFDALKEVNDGVGWSEGCGFDTSGNMYVIYDVDSQYENSKANVAKYNSGGTFVADYNLTYSQSSSDHLIYGYQGVRYIDNYLFVNTHDNVYPTTLNVYHWSGSAFTEYRRIIQPSAYATQGFDVYNGIWYFSERNYGGKLYEYRIIACTPISVAYDNSIQLYQAVFPIGIVVGGISVILGISFNEDIDPFKKILILVFAFAIISYGFSQAISFLFAI